MRVHLDSNIVIAALNGVEPVRLKLANLDAEDVAISVLVLGELTFGAHRSQRREDNLAKIRRLRDTFTVLAVTEQIAARHGAVRAALLS